jgi:hypothetical protein
MRLTATGGLSRGSEYLMTIHQWAKDFTACRRYTDGSLMTSTSFTTGIDLYAVALTRE